MILQKVLDLGFQGPALFLNGRERAGQGGDHDVERPEWMQGPAGLTEVATGRDEATRRNHRKMAQLPSGKTFESWREAAPRSRRRPSRP